MLAVTGSAREGDVEMFLMVLCMSMFGLAVTALAFGTAVRGGRSQPEVELTDKLADKLPLAPSHFFRQDALPPTPATVRVPIEVLLLQLERHVRLEQAAAEAFLDSPTPDSLNSRTMSPLVH